MMLLTKDGIYKEMIKWIFQNFSGSIQILDCPKTPILTSILTLVLYDTASQAGLGCVELVISQYSF